MGLIPAVGGGNLSRDSRRLVSAALIVSGFITLQQAGGQGTPVGPVGPGGPIGVPTNPGLGGPTGSAPIIPPLPGGPPPPASPPGGPWTVIVHGYTSEGSFSSLTGSSGWMRRLATQISDVDGVATNIYATRLDQAAHSLESLSGNGNPLDPSRHHVVLACWTETAADLSDGHAAAAGDALACFIRNRVSAGRLRAMIGHSRGARVCSTAARKLIHAGLAPAQVIYLDSEAGTYQDPESVAWTNGANTTRFDNIYETGGCPGPFSSLGGNPDPTSHDRNLGEDWAHADLQGCIHPPIQEFLIDHLDFDGNRFTWPEDPGDATEEPTEDPAATFAGSLLFNGNFNADAEGLSPASRAGWVPGSMGGVINSQWGRTSVAYLKKSKTTLVHFPFWISGGPWKLKFKVARSANAVGTLKITAGATTCYLDVSSLQASTWKSKSYTANYSTGPAVLKFEWVPQTGQSIPSSAKVYLDEITLQP